jgi:hypothetical protein
MKNNAKKFLLEEIRKILAEAEVADAAEDAQEKELPKRLIFKNKKPTREATYSVELGEPIPGTVGLIKAENTDPETNKDKPFTFTTMEGYEWLTQDDDDGETSYYVYTEDPEIIKDYYQKNQNTPVPASKPKKKLRTLQKVGYRCKKAAEIQEIVKEFLDEFEPKESDQDAVARLQRRLNDGKMGETTLGVYNYFLQDTNKTTFDDPGDFNLPGYKKACKGQLESDFAKWVKENLSRFLEIELGIEGEKKSEEAPSPIICPDKKTKTDDKEKCPKFTCRSNGQTFYKGEEDKCPSPKKDDKAPDKKDEAPPTKATTEPQGPEADTEKVKRLLEICRSPNNKMHYEQIAQNSKINFTTEAQARETFLDVWNNQIIESGQKGYYFNIAKCPFILKTPRFEKGSLAGFGGAGEVSWNEIELAEWQDHKNNYALSPEQVAASVAAKKTQKEKEQKEKEEKTRENKQKRIKKSLEIGQNLISSKIKSYIPMTEEEYKKNDAQAVARPRQPVIVATGFTDNVTEEELKLYIEEGSPTPAANTKLCQSAKGFIVLDGTGTNKDALYYVTCKDGKPIAPYRLPTADATYTMGIMIALKNYIYGAAPAPAPTAAPTAAPKESLQLRGMILQEILKTLK